MKNIVVLFYDKKNKIKIYDFELPIEGYTDFDEFQHELNLLNKKYNILMLDDHSKSFDYFFQNRDEIDLVVNLADNGYENDFSKNALFIELFNYLGLKYTGRQANNVEFFERKDLMLYVFDYLGLNYPQTIMYYPGIDIKYLGKKVDTLKFPVIVKIGISGDSLLLDDKSICNSFKEVLSRIEYIEKILGQKEVILIQEFIENTREYTTLIIGNAECKDIKAYTIKVTPNKFYDFEQKNYSLLPVEDYYKKCDIQHSILNKIEDKLTHLKFITNCKDYVRFDWLLDQDSKFFLLDLNANPSFDSELFKLYNEFFSIKGRILGYIINSALKR
ncbi:MAG: hypothetical protein ACFE9S_11275 [Candidatus Hermodarchaeota archaeon]